MENLTQTEGSSATPSDIGSLFGQGVQLARSAKQSPEKSKDAAIILVDVMLADPSYALSRGLDNRFLRQLLLENAEAFIHSRGRSYSPDFSTASRLKDIAAPTLILYPKEGSLLMHETARLLQKEIPSARSAALPGASRYVNLEDPHGFEQAVLDFLEEHA